MHTKLVQDLKGLSIMSKENIIEQVQKNSNEVYRISEKEYEGYKFIDVRIYYMDKSSGEWKPTRKGISLMPDKVPGVIEGILKAMDEKLSGIT